MSKTCIAYPVSPSTTYRSYPSLAMDEIMDVFAVADYRGKEPINFGKGVSSFNPFDYVDAQLSRSALGEQVCYGDINGFMPLREAICRYYHDKFDYDLNPERVCITDGASGALTIALAMLVEKGGEIILPESCYPAYHVLAQVFEAKGCFVPVTDRFCLDVDQVSSFINAKTQAMIVNSPNNPHGAFLRANDLATLAALDIPIIFDEVYQPLSLVDEAIPSAIHFSDRHFIINSFSKSLAIAGFRVGYLIVPEEHVQTMTNVKAVLNMCTSLPSQMLATQLLEHWDELIGRHQAMLRHNLSYFMQYVNDLDLTVRSQPEAGFFATIDVSATRKNGMQVAHELAKYHALGSTPGIDFQHQNADFLRLNFACQPQQIETGLTRLADYMSLAVRR